MYKRTGDQMTDGPYYHISKTIQETISKWPRGYFGSVWHMDLAPVPLATEDSSKHFRRGHFLVNSREELEPFLALESCNLLLLLRGT